MSSIVVARFDSVPSARSAAHALVGDGFREEAISILYGDPDRTGRRMSRPAWRFGPDLRTRAARWRAIVSAAALAAIGTLGGVIVPVLTGYGRVGMVVGAALGAYAGALAGTCWMASGLRRARAEAAYAGQLARDRVVLLAVQVHPDDEEAAAALLRDAGGLQVEKARSRWWPGARGQSTPTGWRTRAPRPPAQRTQWQP